jgi:DtxR family Mn-dependent transcriptional regulator
MSATHTATADRYLEAIYYIDAEGEVVRPGRLSGWLGVAAPTVTDALRRLERDGWVRTASDRSVTLTASGEEVASGIVRRHRVLERWLTDVLGFDWAEADVEAERIAAAISDEVVARLDESMGRPATCPHGNAIPGRDPGHGELVALASVPAGTTGVVRRISEVAEHEGPALLRLLADHGVGEGTEVAVEAPDRDDVVRVAVAGRAVEMPSESAQRIWLATGRAARAVARR